MPGIFRSRFAVKRMGRVENMIPINQAIPNCIVCGLAGKIRNAAESDRPSFLDCAVCGLGWFDSQPSEDALTRHYEADYPHYLEVEAHCFEEDPSSAEASAKYYLDLLAPHLLVQPTSLIDVGSSFPILAAAMMAQGLQVAAVEPNPQALNWGRARGLSMHAGLHQVSDRFDIVLASHVLEHTRDPLTFLRSLQQILMPGGLLLLKVPNLGSWQASVFDSQWEWHSYPDHLWGFTPLALRSALEMTGFVALSVKTDLAYAGVGRAEHLLKSIPSLAAIEESLRGQQIVAIARPV